MLHPSTILIVDDQASARQVLKGLLIGKGYELIYASSGEEALSKAAEQAPDLILLDVMMPEMDGFEVCRRLRSDAQLAEVPIIMLTALDDQESRLKGLEVGADDFISKPFNRVELQARVQTIIRLNRYRHLLAERTYRQQAEEEVYRRNHELTTLNRVITTVASILNVPDILYLACESLAHLFDLPRATALRLNKEQNQFVQRVEYLAPTLALTDTPSSEEANGSDLSHESFPLTTLILEYLTESKTPLAVTHEQAVSQPFQFYNLMQERGINTLLFVPIYAGDTLEGLVELEAIEQRDFSAQDLTLAQSLATAIGQALVTAQLYQDLHDYADNLEITLTHRTHELEHEHDRTQAILGSVFRVTTIGLL